MKITQNRKIFKIIFEVNVRLVIQLVYMKKQTKARKKERTKKSQSNK